MCTVLCMLMENWLLLQCAEWAVIWFSTSVLNLISYFLSCHQITSNKHTNSLRWIFGHQVIEPNLRERLEIPGLVKHPNVTPFPRSFQIFMAFACSSRWVVRVVHMNWLITPDDVREINQYNCVIDMPTILWYVWGGVHRHPSLACWWFQSERLLFSTLDFQQNDDLGCG